MIIKQMDILCVFVFSVLTINLAKALHRIFLGLCSYSSFIVNLSGSHWFLSLQEVSSGRLMRFVPIMSITEVKCIS